MSETVLVQTLVGFLPISSKNFLEITLMEDPELMIKSIVHPQTIALQLSGVKVDPLERFAGRLKWTCLVLFLLGVIDLFNSFRIGAACINWAKVIFAFVLSKSLTIEYSFDACTIGGGSNLMGFFTFTFFFILTLGVVSSLSFISTSSKLSLSSTIGFITSLAT